MSSTITTTRFVMNSQMNQSAKLARIATPFLAMYNLQQAIIDMASDQITVELFKGNEKVAPLVRRLVGSGSSADNNTIRPGISGADDYLFALIEQKMALPEGTLNKRIQGEPERVSGGDKGERKRFRRRYWFMKLSLDMICRVIRKNEQLCQQSHFDSEMEIKDNFQGDTKLVFPRSAALGNRTVTAAWSDAANAKPWTDIALAFKAIRKHSQINNNKLRYAFLSDSAMTNLRAIYRDQRPGEGPDVNKLNNTYNFNPDNGEPKPFSFLINNGMEYGGWLRGEEFGNVKVHLFTLPEGYDTIEDDSSSNFESWIKGETICVGLFDPSYYRAYYGPGTKVPPKDSIMTEAIGKKGIIQVPAIAGLTIGNSGIPTETMMVNLYPLGQDDGFGASTQHAPIYAPEVLDITSTIDTETTV